MGVDWSEYVDEVGNPYCDETQSASSGCVSIATHAHTHTHTHTIFLCYTSHKPPFLPFRLEDQFDIDAEFEQFQAEEYWHYIGPSLTGEEGEEGEGGLEEEAPDQ